MNKQRIMDMHVHTDNSPDGIHSPMYICENAVDKGLRAIAFTDHCEIDKFFDLKYNSMVFHSYFECLKAKTAFDCSGGSWLLLSKGALLFHRCQAFYGSPIG